MGSFAARLKQPEDYAARVGEYWRRVDAEIRALPWSWAAAHVYHDGLPDARADIVTRIVSEVDSPNYRLVRWLASGGAPWSGRRTRCCCKRNTNC